MTLMDKFKEFVYRLYWIVKSIPFAASGISQYMSAKGYPEIYQNRVKLIEGALLPVYNSLYFLCFRL